MKRYDFWKLSLLNVFSAPLRSGLTVLGFAIGVAAVLAVLSLGAAGKMQVENEMSRLGIDKGWITASAEKPFYQNEAEWLKHNTGVSAQELIYVPAQIEGAKGVKRTVTAIGCEKEYLKEIRLEEGRMPRASEWQEHTPVVLLGKEVAEQIRVECGEIVTVAQKGFEICGIVLNAESVSSVPLESAVLLPVEALSTMTNGIVHELQITKTEKLSLIQAEKLAVRALKNQGHDVTAVTMQVQMEAASSVLSTFISVLGWVALICTLTGGIGIMNILLVSIRDRRREIGVMKSMGALPKQICGLFLLEALCYAALGGILGILLGMVLIYAAGRCLDLQAKAQFGECLALFAGSVAVGAAFGVLPALRAAMLTCVDALRQE